MKKTLEYILACLVDKPDDISVTEEEQNGMVSYTVTVAKEDMGKVIGKEGKVIRAIRNVMKIPAIKENKKVHVSLSENE
ncbi:MAG TPA: KH domain-containing protein [Candidatus Saccharimonadales bacterium]|nr:KH domain-containing protein [Candidatus Saccharimonadales bacterium]